MSISHLLEPGRVLCNVEARSKKHALEILSQLLSSGDQDHSHGEIFDSLISRERLGSTGLGMGVAFPHGRLPGLDASLGAFMKLTDPIDFESQDGEPAFLIFGMIVPEDCSDEHLEDLGQIARLFTQEEFRNALGEANGSSAVYELLTTYEIDPGGGE